jgi:hypothetical protein
MVLAKSKICTVCKIDKSSSDYSLNNGKFRGACKECSNRIKREKRADINLIKQKEKEATLPPPATPQIMLQKCLLCNEEKEYSEYEIMYEKMRKHCKTCYDNLPRPKPKSVKLELTNENSRRKYREKSTEQIEDKKIKAQKYYVKNKETINLQHAEYRKNNKEKEQQRHAIFYQKNKVAIHIYRNKFYESNPLKKLMLKLRQRLSKFYISGNECEDLIGCDMVFLKEWFKFHFELDNDKDMNFTNHGSSWQIDHIIPCCIFDVSIDSHKTQCFHWSNLRPLLIDENLSKGGRLSNIYITEQNIRLHEFCKQEDIPIYKITTPKLQDTSIAGTSLEL